MNQQDILQLKELLSTRKKVVIVTHKNPDGDALGSSLGLYNYLVRKKHSINVITPNSYPSFLQWLPGNDKVIDFTKSPEKAQSAIKMADVIFCLDFNALSRIGEVGSHIKKAKAIKILIDHHLQPEKFAHYMLCDRKACSTAQLVYDFILMLGDKALINKKAANCIYTGIMTDTLNFRIATTTAHTHAVVAELIKLGVQTTQVYSNVFDTYTEDRLRLLGHCLVKEMKVFKEYNAAIITLSKDDLKKYKFQKGDTEGFVNYPLSIDGVVFSAFFTEMQDEIKISLRSKGNFDVNQFARKHFNGGGHANAAGGELQGSLDEAVTKFVNLLPEYKDSLLK